MLKTIILSLFLSVSAIAAKVNFKNDEIIFPKGKSEIEKFLTLLNTPENQKTVGIKNTSVKYNEIAKEGSAVFTIDSSEYMLYEDDFSNTGKKIYFIIFLHSGSGSYSGVQGAYELNGTKLTSLKFDDIVVKNLFPKADMSKFHMRLARPFAVKDHGKIVLRFMDDNSNSIHTYLWEKDKFIKTEL